MTYYRDSISDENRLDGAPINAGKYIAVLDIKAEYVDSYYLTANQIEFEIKARQITAEVG